MNTLINHVQLIGNLGGDPEIGEKNGVKYARFNMAVNGYYTSKEGEKIEDTQWHRVVVFNKLAEVTESILKKGTRVGVLAKLANNRWEDESGVMHYDTSIIGEEILVLSKKES